MDEVALFFLKKTRDDLPCIKGITDHIIFQKGWLLGQHGFTATVLAMKMGFALTGIEPSRPMVTACDTTNGMNSLYWLMVSFLKCASKW